MTQSRYISTSIPFARRDDVEQYLRSSGFTLDEGMVDWPWRNEDNTLRNRIIETADGFQFQGITTSELMNPRRKVAAMKQLDWAANKLRRHIDALENEIERLRHENERLRASLERKP